MKRVIPAALLTICVTMMFSCRKVYTCTCSDGTTVKSVRTLDKQKKKDAKAECSALSGPTLSGTVTVELKCSI